MYNNSEFCYFSSIVIKNRLPLDYSLDKEQTSYDDDLLDALRYALVTAVNIANRVHTLAERSLLLL